jgi:bifunctional non-homologous end joining protein LigD
LSDLVSGVIKRASNQPGFVAPMLAKLVRKLPTGSRWEYEAKWDGYRIEAMKEGKHVRLFSRRGADFTKKFAAAARAVEAVPGKRIVLDGEVVAVDPKGRPSFQVLQHSASMPPDYQLVYYAFDLLNWEGKDMRRLPLEERRARLAELVAHTPVLLSSPLPGTVPSIIKAVRKQGLEGVVAKRRDSLYESGERTGAWVKLPLKPKEDFLIGAYRPAGNLAEILLIGKIQNQKLIFCGKVHQGLNPWNRRELVKALKPLVITKCPFVNLPTSKKTSHWGEKITKEEMREYVWVKPQRMAEVRFAEWTRGGVLRHAEFVALLPETATQ